MRKVNFRDFGFSKKKCRYIESQIIEKNYFGTDRKCRYREFDVIEMTLYGVFFNKDKERKKSGPTNNCRYSEFDVIRSVVIRSLNCIVTQ